MAFITRHVVNITTSTGGSGSGVTTLVYGFVQAIRYVAHASTPYSTTVGIDITAGVSGADILTGYNTSGSFTVAPRNPVVTTTGGSTSGREPVPVADEAVSIAITSGGDTKTGAFHIYVGG